MAKGLAWPIKATISGKAKTIEGASVRRQNIILGLTPASSLHPWHQNLTPPEDIIFDVNDEQTGGQLIAHVYSFFDEQERLGLTMLPRTGNSLQMDKTNIEKGDLAFVVNYVDLEDNRSREVRIGRGRRR